jgi:hypothetical protein
VEHPNPASLAWAAGIIDGEGCITISFRKTPGVHQLIVKVACVEDKMCPELHRIFGGSLWVDKQERHSWTVTGKKAGEVLTLLHPYLVVKQDQADVGIEYAATVRAPGKRTKHGLYPIREPMRQKLFELHAARPHRKE